MFVKPFRTKSNVPIRGSDRKRLRSSVEQAFQSYKFEDSLTSIVPNKEEINVIKIYTHQGGNVIIYSICKNPLFFVHKRLFPTLYFLWQYPLLVPLITTQKAVINKLANGADLMLPGVILPENGTLQDFDVGATIAVNTEENLSAVAVGTALMSSYRIMHSPERQGKAVEILHVFGDHLWGAGERHQPPKLDHSCLTSSSKVDDNEGFVESVSLVSQTNNSQLEEIQNSSTANSLPSDQPLSNSNNADANSPTVVPCVTSNIPTESEVENTKESQMPVETLLEPAEQLTVSSANVDETMDELLHKCCLTALKTKLKDTELPILTGTFYRMKVLACCPPGAFLDIKKTKFKKLNKFLKSLEENNMLKVKELTKGNDHIISVNRTHEELISFKPDVTPGALSEKAAANTESQFGVVTQKQYEPPEISILYGVNSNTLPLFGALGYPKGSTMTSGEVRKLATDYIRDCELVQGKHVTIDPILHDTVCRKAEVDVISMSWEELFKRLLSKMQIHHQLKLEGAAPIIRKGNPCNIEMSIQQRSGNKKVTLVKNLESFLIDPQQFAATIRKIAQASTSVTVIPGSKPTQPMHQVLIQGNQVATIENLLTGDSYKVPRKHLKGLELAPKAKRKQRK